MAATQDNENHRIRSLRPRKPREVNLSANYKESRNGAVLQEAGAERPARRRCSKLSRCLSKAAEKSEDLEQPVTVTHKEGRLGSLAWTDKYKPSKSCPFVGNGATISELRSWLSQWKNKPLNSERSASRQSLSDSEESTEGLSNCYLLVGPPGVGKTSSVYYLAEELGFKVLEVHASSERPGKRILAQLHEATQSHHVEGGRLLFAAPAAQQTACSTKKVEVQKTKLLGPLQQMFEKAAAKGQVKTVKVAAESSVRKPSKGTLDGYFSARNGVSKTPKSCIASTVAAPAGKTSPKGTLLEYFATPVKKGIDSSAASAATSASKHQEECIPRATKGGSEKASSTSDSDVEFVGVTSKAEDQKVSGSGKGRQKTSKRMCSRSDDDDYDDDVVLLEVKESAQKKRLADTAKVPLKKQKTDELADETPIKNISSVEKPSVQDASTLKFSSHTIILFDDVDTIFEQDDGFWSAVESVLSTTKKPIVFTATRNLVQVKAKLPSGCPVAEFGHPRPDEVSKLIVHVFQSEAIDLPISDSASFLLQYYHCDVRKCVLQLQLDTALYSRGQCTSYPFLANAVPIEDDVCKLLHCEVLDTCLTTQRTFEELGLDACHLCLPSTLPLSTVPASALQEVNSDDEVLVEESTSALDSSWLSDEAADNDCESKPTVETSVKEAHPQASVIKQCISELSRMFDVFSSIDYLSGCLEKYAYGTCSAVPFDRIEAWQNGSISLPPGTDAGKFPLPFAVSDALTYTKMGSLRLTSSNLEKCLDGAMRTIPELSLAIYPSVPSLSNLYETAEQNKFWSKCCQQITGLGLPPSAVLNRHAVSDYTGTLQIICKCEKQRKGLKAKRAQRFLHYLSSVGIFLPSDLMEALCKGFRR